MDSTAVARRTVYRRASLIHGATDLAVAEVARYGRLMRTVGVDLSAEARGTGIAVIDWDAGCGRLTEVRAGADGVMVLAALNGTIERLSTARSDGPNHSSTS